MERTTLGPYRLMRVLGRGGMGTVYEGVNTQTGEPAAIKVLSAGLSVDREFRRRFEGEIETLKRLRHPNIVRLFGFGEQEGALYYAMELVDGLSLEEEMARGRRFHWREVARIAIQTCRALRHAHDRGVVHRDIKPANLLLKADEQVKLSDFGIARLFGTGGLTAAGNVLGTVEYMAPEQADAKPVTPKTDLYSLGAVMYALLAGRPPFRASSVLEMLEKHRSAHPEPIARYNTDVPAELERVIQELMEKSPEKRIANASVLARRLEAMLHALSPGRLQPPAVADQKSTAESPVHSSGAEEPGSPDHVPSQTGLASTRPMTTAPQPAEAVEQEHAAASDEPLAETKQTAAFDIYAIQGEQGADVRAPPGPTRPSGLFVPVPEEALDRVETEKPPRRIWLSLQTWILAVGLLGVGLVAWYLLQPPSADHLYKQITEMTARGTVSAYREAEDDINRFLELYSTDPRAETLRDYLVEIDLDRRENRLRLQAKGLATTANILPIESEYLEAIGYAYFDPETAAGKLRALLEFYGDRQDLSGPTGQILELARRRLERLERRIDFYVDPRRARIRERLAEADRIERDDPEAARRIRQAVVVLYGTKPWAAEEVTRAQEALRRQSDHPPTTKQETKQEANVHNHEANAREAP